MLVLNITQIILIILLFAIGIEFFTKLKKNENKKVEDIKDNLTVRINTMITIIVILSIVTVINIIIK
jgi:predicted CDP-diglyceride synthetase/phosphatidate cytidylyltransferase